MARIPLHRTIKFCKISSRMYFHCSFFTIKNRNPKFRAQNSFAPAVNIWNRELVLKFLKEDLRLALEGLPLLQYTIRPEMIIMATKAQTIPAAWNAIPLLNGGVETGSMYLQYVQGIQPNLPAHTTCKSILLLYKFSNTPVFFPPQQLFMSRKTDSVYSVCLIISLHIQLLTIYQGVHITHFNFLRVQATWNTNQDKIKITQLIYVTERSQ